MQQFPMRPARKPSAFVKRKISTFVHPFDDDAIIAGQGTIGTELLEQTAGSSKQAIVVPIGGGGI